MSSSFLYNICCDVIQPNFVTINQAVAQIWRFNRMKKLRHCQPMYMYKHFGVTYACGKL